MLLGNSILFMLLLQILLCLLSPKFSSNLFAPQTVFSCVVFVELCILVCLPQISCCYRFISTHEVGDVIAVVVRSDSM